MNKQQLLEQSEHCLRNIITDHLPAGTPVHLFGSRARHDGRWNSDFDLWIDGDLDPMILGKITEAIDESFIPFKVDLVLTSQLKGVFGDMVKKEAVRWI